MGNKKMGRPTDNPKDISLKVRLDKDTAEKLDEILSRLMLIGAIALGIRGTKGSWRPNTKIV